MYHPAIDITNRIDVGVTNEFRSIRGCAAGSRYFSRSLRRVLSSTTFFTAEFMEDGITRGSPPFNLASNNGEKRYFAYTRDTHKQSSDVLLRINGPFPFNSLSRANIRQMAVGSLNAFPPLFRTYLVKRDD